MIIGDPYKFAIHIDIVDDWASSRFVGGFFYIYINGCFFPKDTINTTISGEIYRLYKEKKSSLLTKPINNILFNKKKDELFMELNNMTFPSCYENDVDNDYTYYSRFDELGDQNCYIFAVSNGEYVRILGGEISKYFGKKDQEDLVLIKDVNEVFISNTELDDIMKKLENYYKKNIIPRTLSD